MVTRNCMNNHILKECILCNYRSFSGFSDFSTPATLWCTVLFLDDTSSDVLRYMYCFCFCCCQHSMLCQLDYPCHAWLRLLVSWKWESGYIVSGCGVSASLPTLHRKMHQVVIGEDLQMYTIMTLWEKYIYVEFIYPHLMTMSSNHHDDTPTTPITLDQISAVIRWRCACFGLYL